MARLGTDKNPLLLSVHTKKGAAKAMALCEMYDWSAIVRVEPNEPVDLDDLQLKLDSIPLQYDAPKVGRNENCPCGSGKKLKKCCLQ